MTTHTHHAAAHSTAHATTAHAAAHSAAHATTHAAHATAHSATHAAHAAKLSGGTLSDDSGGQNDPQLTLGLVRDRHGHAAVTDPFGFDGY